MHRSLIVLPDDSAQPILEAINHAAKSIRVNHIRRTKTEMDVKSHGLRGNPEPVSRIFTL